MGSGGERNNWHPRSQPSPNSQLQLSLSSSPSLPSAAVKLLTVNITYIITSFTYLSDHPILIKQISKQVNLVRCFNLKLTEGQFFYLT